MYYLFFETISLFTNNILIQRQNQLASEKAKLTEDDLRKIYITRLFMVAEFMKSAAFFAFLAHECMEKSILTTFVKF